MTDYRLGGLVAEIDGDGPPVVMVHGLGGSSNSFTPLMHVLEGFQVMRPDLPGAGRSQQHPGRPGLDGLGAAVTDLLRALEITHAHFVGHSMGTLICQHLAASEPALVASLTLYGPILEPPQAARHGMRARASDARGDGMAGIADAVTAASLSGATHRTNPAAVAFVRESLMHQDPAGYARHCEALADARAADHSAIRCPTWLIVGSDDRVAPPDMARALAGEIADASCDIIEGCGHWAMIEAPAESARVLQAHLQSVTGEAA